MVRNVRAAAAVAAAAAVVLVVVVVAVVMGGAEEGAGEPLEPFNRRDENNARGLVDTEKQARPRSEGHLTCPMTLKPPVALYLRLRLLHAQTKQL